MGTKVYRYGLLPPTENAELVRRQMRLAHEYRNKLVEIERAERAEVRALQQTHGSIPMLEAASAAATQAREAAYAAIKSAKAKDRTRKVSPALRDSYDAARVAANEAAQALRVARAAMRADPTIAVKRDEISLRYLEKRKAARAACGVYWGTYLAIEAADSQSRKTTPLWHGTETCDPRFVRWTGEGAVGVQIQGGLPVGALHQSRHLRIEAKPLPPGADPKSKRSARRKYATLALRIGTDDEREPVWARWPLVLHRPLPDDALIKWARVLLRKIGPREEWALIVTVECEDRRQRPPPEPENRLAVDIGWRKQADGSIRAAAWRSDSGDHGFLVLDTDLLSQHEKSDGLRQTRDDNFNAAKAALVAALPGLNLPDWFPKNVWQWRSLSRMAALARRWKTSRFAGDDLAYAQLEAWRYHDHHLWAWETSQRTKALRHRLDVYRVFAAQMARKYTGLVVESFDMRRVATKPSADQQEGDNERARANRQRVAVSELRRALVSAFGAAVTFAPPQYTTSRCAACGSQERWDQAAEVEHTCSACGAKWDQDDNATLNLLAYREPPGDAQDPGTARSDEISSKNKEVQESKWTKAKRMGREKRARVEAARNAPPNAAE